MSYRKWLADLLPSASKHSSSIYGSYSGGGKNECDEGISLAILIATLAGIAVLAFTLFTKITMIGRRRRRHLELPYTSVTKIMTIVNSGMFPKPPNHNAPYIET